MQPFHYVGAMMMAGIVLGVVFDFYNTVTGASKWLRWLRPTLDISYWIASAIFVYHLTLVTDAGRFRFYTFGLVGFGYVLYRIVFHRIVCQSAFAVVHLVRSICMFAWRIVYTLTVRPLLFIGKLMRGLLKFLYQVGCRIEDGLFIVIRILMRIVRFPFEPILQKTIGVQEEIIRRWEGIWLALSKWLCRKPDEI